MIVILKCSIHNLCSNLYCCQCYIITNYTEKLIFLRSTKQKYRLTSTVKLKCVSNYCKRLEIFQGTYFYTYAISRSFNQLTGESFLLFQHNWIAKFPTDKPFELAHSIFQVKYHLKDIKYKGMWRFSVHNSQEQDRIMCTLHGHSCMYGSFYFQTCWRVHEKGKVRFK